jgi:hypothetical protein
VLGGRICIWLLLFQENEFEVIMKPMKFNLGLDHLSCILSIEDARNLDEILPDTHLFAIYMVDDYFSDIIKFLSTGVDLLDFTVA